MKFPHTLFKRAGLNSTDVANLFQVSRVTGARWLSGVDRNGNAGVGVNKFLEAKVAKTASAIQHAVEGGDMPDKDVQKLPPAKRAKNLKALIRLYSTK